MRRPEVSASAPLQAPHLPLVLVICTGNSCRSQMAEAFLRQAAGDILRVASAGSQPADCVHPLAIDVMAEEGLDLSSCQPKALDTFANEDVETVITVCGSADQACPRFPGEVNRHHWSFDDPAGAKGTSHEQRQVFRKIRDEIKRVFQAYASGRRDSLALKST